MKHTSLFCSYCNHTIEVTCSCSLHNIDIFTDHEIISTKISVFASEIDKFKKTKCNICKSLFILKCNNIKNKINIPQNVDDDEIEYYTMMAQNQADCISKT